MSLFLALALALTQGTTAPQTSGVGVPQHGEVAAAAVLAPRHLRGSPVECEACTVVGDLSEVVSTPRRSHRHQAGKRGEGSRRSLQSQKSRVRALIRSRFSFARDLAQASAGTSDQTTTLPPPTRA